MSIQSISTPPPAQSRAEASSISAAQDRKLAEPAKEPAQPVGREQVKAALGSVREYIEPINGNLEFSINDDTQQIVIRVTDKVTKELIRQIPSEEMIAMAKALDTIKGLLIQQQA